MIPTSASRSKPLATGQTARRRSTPERDVDDTLHQLLMVEIVVALAVLTAVFLLGLWLVRVGLRPLGRIEHDRGRDRRRRPLAARRERRSARPRSAGSAAR